MSHHLKTLYLTEFQCRMHKHTLLIKEFRHAIKHEGLQPMDDEEFFWSGGGVQVQIMLGPRSKPADIALKNVIVKISIQPDRRTKKIGEKIQVSLLHQFRDFCGRRDRSLRYYERAT